MIRIGSAETPNGIHVIDGFLTDQEGEGFDISALGPLRGKHNWQNVAAAWAVARTYGITSEKIAASLKAFSGSASPARDCRKDQQHRFCKRL